MNNILITLLFLIFIALGELVSGYFTVATIVSGMLYGVYLLKYVESKEHNPYKSSYKSSEFTKQRVHKGKKQVFHKDDGWLDYATISLLLIDNENDSGYTELDSLKVFTDKPVTRDDYSHEESKSFSNSSCEPSYSGGSYSSSSSSSYDSCPD